MEALGRGRYRQADRSADRGLGPLVTTPNVTC